MYFLVTTTFLIFFFRGAKFEFGARIVSPFSRSAKTIHYKDVTSLVVQNTGVFMADTKKSRPGKGIAPLAAPAL